MHKHTLVLVLCLGCGKADDPPRDDAGAEAGGSVALRYDELSFAGVRLEDQMAGMAWYEDVLGLTCEGDNKATGLPVAPSPGHPLAAAGWGRPSGRD